MRFLRLQPEVLNLDSIFLYINIVSDAINAVNLLDACSVKPLCKGFCVGDSCFSNRSLMTDSIIF
jgi:hypothetical protein